MKGSRKRSRVGQTHPSGKLRDGLELGCNRINLLIDVAKEAGLAILADVVVDPDIVDEETRVAYLEIARKLGLYGTVDKARSQLSKSPVREGQQETHHAFRRVKVSQAVPDDDWAVKRLAAEVSGRKVEDGLGAGGLEREGPSESRQRRCQSEQQGGTPHVQDGWKLSGMGRGGKSVREGCGRVDARSRAGAEEEECWAGGCTRSQTDQQRKEKTAVESENRV